MVKLDIRDPYVRNAIWFLAFRENKNRNNNNKKKNKNRENRETREKVIL